MFSEATDQYYLFVTVTDTTAAGGGSADPGCTGDSAIGVAVGDTPVGPWESTGAPVVAPRCNGPGCNFFWTYDPDVLGDTVGSSSVLYYGSYYGGMFATPITFAADGVSTGTTADDTQIAIGNRYEGANVVFRDGTTTCSPPRRTAATVR